MNNGYYSQKLLISSLAAILVLGVVIPAYAQLNSGEDIVIPQDFVPSPATPASMDETLIDFETFPDTTPIPNGTPITTQFAPSGVSLFTTTDPGGPLALQTALAGQSGLNVLIGVPFGPATSPIGIEFTGCVTDVSVLGLDVGGAGLILEAFNSANVMVDSDSVTNAGIGIGNVDTLSVSGSEIVRVDIRQITPGLGGDGFVIDDLRFSECIVVGGEFLPIDSTALILAGAQTNAVWIMSALAVIGSIAFGALYITSKKN